MPARDPVALDGNVLAGRFGLLGSLDITTAVLRCAGCGRTDVVAAARVYVSGMGAVARCAGCDAVLVVCVERPGGTLVAMPGTVWLSHATGPGDVAT